MKDTVTELPDNLLCFSHLRWDFVFQRPQHLLSRFAKTQNVFFLEEPIFDADGVDYLDSIEREQQLVLLVPHFTDTSRHDPTAAMKALLGDFMKDEDLNNWMFWYYTPMALQFSAHYQPAITIFDCMDELSAFDFAPAEMLALEWQLMQTADIVFTGGYSLYEAKKTQHKNIFPFPSSIDKTHFSAARKPTAAPDDQAKIVGTKIGFFGVIDERFDIDLIAYIAEQRPDWQLVLIGPVLKIAPERLPKRENIHYLGQKTYAQLPSYLSSWDLALIPFKLNEATKFISPTKTPEYLAAGKMVVTTPIRDVINPYGVEGLVSIAHDPKEFVEAIDQALSNQQYETWLEKVDLFLEDKSWDHTYAQMKKNILATLNQNCSRLAS